MRVREYMEFLKSGEKVTFIKARARENAGAPGYHAEYQTTPVQTVSEWLDPRWEDKTLLGSVILNDKAMPIDWLSGALWSHWVEDGTLLCFLIISEDDFELMFPNKDQREHMAKYIDARLDVSLL